MSKRERRSILPGVLIVAGVAGLGLAAASELDLAWNGTFQSGVEVVGADCQPSGQEIGVSFSEPTFASGPANTQTPWSVAQLEFSNIAAACASNTYEVAVRIAEGEWLELGSGDVVAAPTGGATTIAVDLGATDPQQVTDVALTIHGAAPAN